MNSDVFNGDADGLCALHQLRLVRPSHSQLVTGVKRDITLLRQLNCRPGDLVTVLDISLDTNFAELNAVLDSGARVTYFDHHAAERRFAHPALELHWDDSPDVCTSILVDRYLQGAHRLWTIVAAFGDNLQEIAMNMGAEAGLHQEQIAILQQLGFLLNYNAYGEQLADLHFHPADLYQQLHEFLSPFDCFANAAFVPKLASAYQDDAERIKTLQPFNQQADSMIYVLPDQAWARRMSGMLANQLAHSHRRSSFAVLTETGDGDYVVSVRSAAAVTKPANVFCTRFRGGGGRSMAAGINHLPRAELDSFSQQFFAYFSQA